MTTNSSLHEQLLEKSHWNDRYRLLLSAAKIYKTDKNIQQPEYEVAGCTATTWIKHSTDNQRHYFQVDSESKIILGLALLLVSLYNEKTHQEAQQVNIEKIFTQLDLNKHLSKSRSNGFYALHKKILAHLYTT